MKSPAKLELVSTLPSPSSPTHASPWWGCTNTWQVEENMSTGREGAEGHPFPLLQTPSQNVGEGSFNTVKFSILKF